MANKLTKEDMILTASKALLMIKEDVNGDFDLVNAVITEIQSQINIDVQLGYENKSISD